MITRVDVRDPLRDDRRVRVDPVRELPLGRRRAEDEDLVRRFERTGDLLEEVRVVERGLAALSMEVVSRGEERLLVEPFEVDVEDARLVMIEPHCGTRASGHAHRCAAQSVRSPVA
jgi:hypothetical protein